MCIIDGFQLFSADKMTGEDACFVLTAVLRGLEQHGEHDGHQAALISLALVLYENLVSSLSASNTPRHVLFATNIHRGRSFRILSMCFGRCPTVLKIKSRFVIVALSK
jgi:hypothetical protein